MLSAAERATEDVAAEVAHLRAANAELEARVAQLEAAADAARDERLVMFREANLPTDLRYVKMRSVREQVAAQKLIDAATIAAGVGYAAEVTPVVLQLNRETWSIGDKGAVNDMLVRSAAKQFAYLPMRKVRRASFEGTACTTQLMRSAAAGDVGNVCGLLSAGAPLNGERDSAGYWALHWAAENGHAGVVKVLLSYEREGRNERPHVDAVSHKGFTALMVASSRGHARVVVMLLDAGANQLVELPRDNYTAMHLAVHGGHAAAVESLCAGPQTRDALTRRCNAGRTMTPLRLALGRGAAGAACAAILRRHGATE